MSSDLRSDESTSRPTGPLTTGPVGNDRIHSDPVRRDWGVFIDGQWTDPVKGGRADAVNPATGEVFATVASATTEDADIAVRAASKAARDWAAQSAFDRSRVSAEAAALIIARRDELALALSEDQGKPLHAEAYDEVDELAEYFRMAAADAERTVGTMPPSTDSRRRVLGYRVPLGVIAVVSPWNWPYTMGAEIFAPALAAGNAVVWVPAPSTTACCSLLTDVMARAGFPPGVFNFVPGPGPVVGDAVVGHPLVNGVGFVGSVATGRSVAARSAGKAQVLELGGNGPFVVLDDADLDLAASATMESAFLCAGQSCTAGELFLVHRKVRAELVERIAAMAAEIRLGDPLDPATTMGPLNNEPTASKFCRHVDDARDRGARVVIGGSRAGGFPTDLYVEPTVLDGVTAEMAVSREETFGPVVPIMEVSSDAEALAIANGSPYGLTGAVFTGDLGRGLRFAETLRTGWVNINASTNPWESHLPFGGRSGSDSGIGRVGGRYVMEAFTEPKTVIFPLPPEPLGR